MSSWRRAQVSGHWRVHVQMPDPSLAFPAEVREPVDGVRESMPARAVLTIATGKRLYLDMAIALARSFGLWHADSDIGFFIATDLDDPLPSDLASWVQVLRHPRGALGSGFSVKLHLDKLAPAEQSLFIDADCLCLGALGPVFDRFAGHAVSVVGGPVAEGEWFGDIGRTREQFGLDELTKFNGGVYYIERGPVASAVYQRARALESRYDDIGLVRLRDCPNEELLMSIAMGLEGCKGIEDDGTIHGELFSCPRLLELDALSGKARLQNPPPDAPDHRASYPVRTISPVVVHFLGDFTSKWPYRSQERILRLVCERGWPPLVARVLVAVGYGWPCRAQQWLRERFRPAYRRFFGPRAVRYDERF